MRAQRSRWLVWMKKVRKVRWHGVVRETLKAQASNFVLDPCFNWTVIHFSPVNQFINSFASRHAEWLSQHGDCARRYHLKRVYIKLLYTMTSHLCTVITTIWALERNLEEYHTSVLIGKIYGYRHLHTALSPHDLVIST